jgi:hypothetical protein
VRSLAATAALAVMTLGAGVAQAAPVTSLNDSLPSARGRQLQLNFNPSQYVAQNESPSSLAFYLPARWRLDTRAVKRECSAAQAAAVKCPRASWIGFGYTATHVSGYLCPGGGTDAIAYINAYLGQSSAVGDPASMVLEVNLLSARPLIDAVNKTLGTHIQTKYSVIGRVIALHSGPYGPEVSFASIPGGITVPQIPGCAGLSAKVTLFKLLVGVVRRVKKPFVHVITVETLNGPTTERIHDHHLIGYHLLDRPVTCPATRRWPWQIVVGVPSGQQRVMGTMPCGALHRGLL